MTLTFNVPEQMFQMALLLVKVNNCQIILKSMHKCTSYGPKKSGRTHNARTHKPCTSHAQATHNACTYTELKLYQLCLAPCKLARQKCNGIKTAKEDFKESPSFEHPIILSKDTCGRFFSDFVHYYRPFAVLLP